MPLRRNSRASTLRTWFAAKHLDCDEPALVLTTPVKKSDQPRALRRDDKLSHSLVRELPARILQQEAVRGRDDDFGARARSFSFVFTLIRVIVENYRSLQPAADADPLDSETSLTTSAVSLFSACLAMSASATMPQQAPLASTTGTRLI